ncbi:MAG: hypothetical protein ACRDV9_02075 [Acidimicrobiia bacterium]
MQVEVRPIEKLRGARRIDLMASLGPLIEALSDETLDLSNLRVVCEWIQYRGNFRDPVDLRPIVGPAVQAFPAPGERVTDDGLEIALDLRRAGEVDLRAALHDALRALLEGHHPGRIYLEAWVPESKSRIWRFNDLYWRALSLWEEATGREYEQALPGGESDARNRDATRALILSLFDVWEGLEARNALPGELYILELGVGNGNQAKTWLDEFVNLDRAHGHDYYRRLHYLMGDYSPHVLERAQSAVSAHKEHVSALVLDATQPTKTLGFLRYKTFLVYMSNVYDNLPSDEVASIRGRAYGVEVRAYLPADTGGGIAKRLAVTPAKLPALVEKLLRLGPEVLHESLSVQFPTLDSAVEFWRECWAEIKLEERYVRLEGLDSYEIAPSLTGETLRPLLESHGDVRMHVSNGAVSSFAGTLPLLHPFGQIQCHDLFVTDVGQYQTGFRGPGKYDGSVVNWVNGLLLERIGARRGFKVCFAPFRHREGSNVQTLTVNMRD